MWGAAVAVQSLGDITQAKTLCRQRVGDDTLECAMMGFGETAVHFSGTSLCLAVASRENIRRVAEGAAREP